MVSAPWVFDSALGLNLLSQMGIAMIACLSFNLLFGQGGMLSFGHAVYTGVGAYAAIHALRWMAAHSAWALPVSAVPLLGGLASAGVAVVLGGITTRRGGLSLAMITLGLGELVYAAAHMFEPVFGGEGGLSANRVMGSRPLGISLGPQLELYALIAAYTLLCAGMMAVLTRAPLGRALAAVRENPERAGFLGLDEARVRYRVFVWAAFFAGIAGGLAALNFENVTPEVFSSHRSGSYVLFTYLGGAGYFFGPVLGAVLMVLTQVLLSSYTPGWLLYLGLFFVGMVVLAPQGLASLPTRFWGQLQHQQPQGRDVRGSIYLAVGAAFTLAGSITLIEMGYHLQLGSALGPDKALWGLSLRTDQPLHWWFAGAVFVSGLGLIGLGRTLRQARQVQGLATDLQAFRPGTLGDGRVSEGQGQPAGLAPTPTPPTQATQATIARPPTLELHQLGKRVGESDLLQDVSLSVVPGECLALIGPNGAGKSTLFNLISGRTRPTRGTVRLGARRLDRLQPRQIHAMGVGRSFQVSHLFAALSVAENIRCAVLAHSGLAERLFHRPNVRAEIDRETQHLLHQLDLFERQHMQAQHLSYAEQRALELGLALAADPQVILLDEPTAGMNQAETQRTLALIRALTRGKTLLIVEHDMNVVFELADRIAVLEQGRLIACDTPQAVRADVRVQQAYLGQVPDPAAPDATPSEVH
jgi:branched-chain amino acid transport system permease protein